MNVAEFNSRLEADRKCDGCPMYGKGQFVGVDCATGCPGPCTVLFLGLNPGREEARQGLPFVGPSGQFLRAQMAKTGISGWAMANSLLCSSANESEIVQADSARAHCHPNHAKIFSVFKPQIIVPCGNGAWSLFKVNTPITSAASGFFVSRGPAGKAAPVLVLPILHPSALIRSGKESSSSYPGFYNRLQAISFLEKYVDEHGMAESLELIRKRNKTVQHCFAGGNALPDK